MMKPIKALYVDWYTPRKNAGKSTPEKRPWEIAMVIRTTHFARKFNDLSPVLYCDVDTYEYYERIGLLKYFDEVKPILPVDTPFDSSVFWSAGKFYAIRDCDEPFILIDLDAEIRFKVDYGNCDVYCAHLERITENDLKYYPEAVYMDKENYIANNFDIEWSNYACNTCLISFSDLDFAKEYSNSSLNFIESLDNIDPAFTNSAYTILIEQRFLYELCRTRKKKIGTMISGDFVPVNSELGLPAFENSNVNEIGNKGFYHVWGFKNDIRKSQLVEDEFYRILISTAPDVRNSILEAVSLNHKLYI